MSDSEIALNAAMRIQANQCSAKYFFMAQKSFEKGKSFLSTRDFVRAEEAFNRARKFAERAELGCIVSKNR